MKVIIEAVWRGDGTSYGWRIEENGRTVTDGDSPTLLTACRDVGNVVYDVWGYSPTMGRLVIHPSGAEG